MEVGRLGPDPGEKAAERRIGAERGRVVTDRRQLLVGKGGVDRTVADRMHRPRLPTAAAFRNRVMIFDPPAEWAAAQPAGLDGIKRHAIGYRLGRTMSAFDPLRTCGWTVTTANAGSKGVLR